ncbi:MAG: hypothetical protein FWC83_01605, partial [Alphaproteobacteria bacterium]|nr:hypothetical protein [Alphaproteobacteria bacterium]
TTPCGKEIACTGCTCAPSKLKCVRNIVVLLVVFALGFMACRLCPHSGHNVAVKSEQAPAAAQHRLQFDDNGCLIITNERMAQRFTARGMDTACITRAQMRELRQEREAREGERPRGERPRGPRN